MANRIILFLAGLALTFCAMWAGSALGVAVGPVWGMRGIHAVTLTLLVPILGVVSLILGAVSCSVCYPGVIEDKRFDDSDAITVAAMLAICAAFLFGEIVQPIGVGGGSWWTPWIALLIVGFTPMLIAGKDIIEDLFCPGPPLPLGPHC